MLERTGITAAALRRRRDGRLILAFHNVVPDDAPRLGDQSLHLPLGTFRAVLDECAALGDIVPLTQLLAAPPGAVARPRIALTFDDAYQGFVRHALPELERRALPATLFVAPEILGAGTMWWDAIAESAGLSPELRTLALETHAGGHSAIATAWRDSGRSWRVLPADWQIADEPLLRTTLQSAALTIAPHSWSHANLMRCRGSTLVEEMQRPLSWLREFAGHARVAPILAYPYGLSDADAETAARAAGYTHGLRVDGGWFPRTEPPAMRVPRLNVPAGISRRGVRLRLAGLVA